MCLGSGGGVEGHSITYTGQFCENYLPWATVRARERGVVFGKSSLALVLEQSNL